MFFSIDDILNFLIQGRQSQFFTRWSYLASPSLTWAWHSSGPACLIFFFLHFELVNISILLLIYMIYQSWEMSNICSAFAVLDIIYFMQTFKMPKEMRQQEQNKTHKKGRRVILLWFFKIYNTQNNIQTTLIYFFQFYLLDIWYINIKRPV